MAPEGAESEQIVAAFKRLHSDVLVRERADLSGFSSALGCGWLRSSALLDGLGRVQGAVSFFGHDGGSDDVE
jgi:hypothetical protein